MVLRTGRSTTTKAHFADPIWGTWLEEIKSRYTRRGKLDTTDAAALINEVYHLRERLWVLRGEPKCPMCGATDGLTVIPTAPLPISPTDGSVFFVHPPCDRPFIGRAPEDYVPSRPDRI